MLNFFSTHAFDFLFLIGCICASAGLWQIHPPTCLVVVGLSAMAMGVILGRPRK